MLDLAPSRPSRVTIDVRTTLTHGEMSGTKRRMARPAGSTLPRSSAVRHRTGRVRRTSSGSRRILVVMTSSRAPRRYLAGSPFQPEPEPAIEQFECGDLVSHDAYGMGRVVGREAEAVTVDFRTQTVRVMSPFHKMAKL
jgi:hypothetical protein